MYAIESHRCSDVPVTDRAEWWSELVSSIHSRMAFRIRDGYLGRIEHQHTEAYQLVRWWGDEEFIKRSGTDVRRHPHGAQLAKTRGASLVIGSAGGAEKARYLTGTLGLDAAVDYRAGHLAGQLRGVAPEGIDLYFDNVGGDHLEAAIDLLRVGGRAVICGMISGYGKPPGPGPGNLTQLIVKRLRVEGFLVLDHLHRRAAFEQEILPLVEDGTLHSEVTIFDDLESAPHALLALLRGTKLSKALVRP